VIEYTKAIGASATPYKQISFTPFDPAIKRAEAIFEHEGERFKAVKGAPQIIISMCTGIDEETQAKANEKIQELSRQGYRILAVAKSESNRQSNLRFVGFLPLADPPRPDSKSMIEELKTLGVRVIMLTGDNISIAREIASEVSIGNKIVQMAEFRELNETEQARIIEEYDGVAEIYPEDKYRIVKLLQSKGHIVGMTGDGVNDSPALKQAEVGIAVSNSMDVAKASASIVLTEPGIREIIDAIKTSRQIYQRMLSWVINKVTKTIQFVGLLVVGFFWLNEVVLSTLGMVLLVFANDFVTMSLATDNVKHTSSPNRWNVRNITLASLVIGLLMIVEGVIALLVGIKYFHLGLVKLQSLILLLLVFTSQFRIYIVRERERWWSSRPGRELLIISTATIVGFIILGTYGLIIPSITFHQVLFILGFSALFTLSIDSPKYYAFRKFGL
jgi:H+-transporting ATPase